MQWEKSKETDPDFSPVEPDAAPRNTRNYFLRNDYEH